jgi:hypothetical protein
VRNSEILEQGKTLGSHVLFSEFLVIEHGFCFQFLACPEEFSPEEAGLAACALFSQKY